MSLLFSAWADRGGRLSALSE